MNKKNKVSIVIPVYYNQDNLLPLYNDISKKLFSKKDIEWEIVFVNDGSKDQSYKVMQELASKDKRIKNINLSRNFGSYIQKLNTKIWAWKLSLTNFKALKNFTQHIN